MTEREAGQGVSAVAGGNRARPDGRKYPDTQRKYECEMRMVADARAALARVVARIAQLEEMVSPDGPICRGV